MNPAEHKISRMKFFKRELQFVNVFFRVVFVVGQLGFVRFRFVYSDVAFAQIDCKRRITPSKKFHNLKNGAVKNVTRTFAQ